MRILDEVEKVENYLISCRRILHENPEISDCELNTIQFICEELKKIGIKTFGAVRRDSEGACRKVVCGSGKAAFRA